MSAVAAGAAVVVPFPRGSSGCPAGGPAGDAPVGRSRRRLRSVPAAAGPGSGRVAGNPLSLGRDARARLGGAVRALLGVAGLDGASDAVRLAVVVLASRTPSETGVVEIRTGELGRWLGLSASYVASEVVPVLRRSGVVSVEKAEGEYGQDTGLRCTVLPLWAAQDVAGHPLALAKAELATLLRLVEAVMAPGWAHRDGGVTRAGLVGTRTGRGAATDRLALLLLVLEARETGRVRQCGGTVDTRRGRAAATVARLLGCTASAGERVLERLEDRELVLRVRLKTGSGMPHRSRLVVPAVAAAHGRTVAGGVREDRAQALEPGFSGPDVAAGPGEPSETQTGPQVSGVPVADEAGVAEPDVAAALHTDHPHPATPVVPLQLSGGFSGGGRGGEGRRPERVCPGEDRTAGGGADPGRLTLAGGSGGPLRGDKPNKSATNGQQNHSGEQPVRGASAARSAVVGGAVSGRRPGRVPRPPRDLEAVFGAVGPVWACLERSGARRRVVEAARRELAAVAGVTGPGAAGGVLAGRLVRRLAAQGGPASVTDPVGWLIGRGLPRRAECGDLRCDEGLRMDAGTACETCAHLVADRRGLRHRVAAAVDADLPAATPGQRREMTEQRLREAVAVQAERARTRQEQAAAGRAARQASAVQARAEAEARERVRLALPCAACGTPDAAGLCAACGNRQIGEEQVREAALTTAAAYADTADPEDVNAVTAHVETRLRGQVQTACGQARADGATDSTLALLARLTAETAAAEHRRSALSLLARTAAARTEATRAYAAVMRTGHRHPTRTAARAAAAEAAEQARYRTARHLLHTRLTTLRRNPPGPVEGSSTEATAPVRRNWAERLAPLAERRLSEDAVS